MRIDDRKVNGRIMIEATDAVQCFAIGVDRGFDEDSKPITRNSAAVAAQLKILLGDHAGPPVRFSVVESNGASVTVFTPVLYNVSLLGTSGNVKVLPMPAYTFDPGITKLSIDIGELITGVILEIALPSGTITVKESK